MPNITQAKLDHMLQVLQTSTDKIKHHEAEKTHLQATDKDLKEIISVLKETHTTLDKDLKGTKELDLFAETIKRIQASIYLLQTQKSTQEKVGAVQNALLSVFKETLKDFQTLIQTLEKLKRGQRVEKAELDTR